MYRKTVLGDQLLFPSAWMDREEVKAEEFEIQLLGLRSWLHRLPAIIAYSFLSRAVAWLCCSALCSSKLIPTPVPLHLLCQLRSILHKSSCGCFPLII